MSSSAPRGAILLPVAFLIHLVEEWLGDFPAWTRMALGNEVTAERFVAINAIGLVLFTAGTLAALRWPGFAWFSTSFAALLGLNGVLHTLATLGLARYSPGTVTGLLLYIPLSAVVLSSSKSRLSPPVFAASIVFGILLHGLVTFVALR